MCFMSHYLDYDLALSLLGVSSRLGLVGVLGGIFFNDFFRGILIF